MPISCPVTVHLICVFVFAHADCLFAFFDGSNLNAVQQNMQIDLEKIQEQKLSDEKKKDTVCPTMCLCVQICTPECVYFITVPM